MGKRRIYKRKSSFFLLSVLLVACGSKTSSNNDTIPQLKKADNPYSWRWTKGSTYSTINPNYKGPNNLLLDLSIAPEIKQVATTADGNYIYFVTTANLTTDNLDYRYLKIYRRSVSPDGIYGSVELVSQRYANSVLLSCGTANIAQETQLNGDAYNISVSNNGRYVAFLSDATNLVPQNYCEDVPEIDILPKTEDSIGDTQIYLLDTVAKTTTLISGSLTDDGINRMGVGVATEQPAISGDGNVVAYVTAAASNDFITDGPTKEQKWIEDPETEDTSSTTEIILFNKTTKEMGWASYAGTFATPERPDGSSTNPILSYDGRYLAFASEAKLTPNDNSNGVSDIYRAEFQMGPDGPLVGSRKDIKLVSIDKNNVSSTGIKDRAGNFNPTMSNDGRYIAFSGIADDTRLVNGWLPNTIAYIDGKPVELVYIRDMSRNITSLASAAQEVSGVSSNFKGFKTVDDHAFDPILSPDGNYLMYTTTAGYQASYDQATIDYLNAEIVSGTENSCKNLVFNTVTGPEYKSTLKFANFGSGEIKGGWQEAVSSKCLAAVDPKNSDKVYQVVLTKLDLANLRPKHNTILSTSPRLIVNHLTTDTKSAKVIDNPDGTKTIWSEFRDVEQLMYGDRDSRTGLQAMSNNANIIAFTSAADSLWPNALSEERRELPCKFSASVYQCVPDTDINYYFPDPDSGAPTNLFDSLGLYHAGSGKWTAFTYNVYKNPPVDPFK